VADVIPISLPDVFVTYVADGEDQSNSIRDVACHTLQRHVAGMAGNIPDEIERDYG
jgi:hypothetical protein